VVTALIAAGVSVVVAAATGVVTYLTTRASLRRDRDRQQAEFRRNMTARLYDRRVAVYPGLFAATDAFRRSHINGADDLATHLREALAEVDEWHAREGGLMLSADAYMQFLHLRLAARRLIENISDHEHLAEYKQGVWACKNRLRTAMRADLGLMFDEDQSNELWTSPAFTLPSAPG
jgi:hypothetical protein